MKTKLEIAVAALNEIDSNGDCHCVGVARGALSEITASQAPSIGFTLMQLLQDYFVDENEYNSVEFDAIFGRYTDQQLADELMKRVASQAAPAVLSNEQIEAMWQSLPGIEIHNKAASMGMSTDRAVRLAFAQAILAAAGGGGGGGGGGGVQ
jgi:hypothetical protein